MTWIPLLLTDPSPCLRLKVLQDLLKKKSDDPEISELSVLKYQDPLYKNSIQFQKVNGSWNVNSASEHKISDEIRATSIELIRLGYIGFNIKDEAIKKGADFLLSQQATDGSWKLNNKKSLTKEEQGYEMMPIQTALPLFALLICGFSSSKQIDDAFEWLLKYRLDDGAWPVGIHSGVYGGIAGYRRLAHSRWGCRSNTTAVLTCFAYHPTKRKSEIARRALDLILGTTIESRNNLGFYTARRIGLELSYGYITYFARFDIAQILDLAWHIEANQNDTRILNFINYLNEIQGKYGLWEYINHPIATRWVSYDILRSLANLDSSKEWIAHEPITPFQAYTERERRY